MVQVHTLTHCKKKNEKTIRTKISGKTHITCIMTALIYPQASQLIQQDYVSPGYTASRHPQSMSMQESMSCCDETKISTSKAEAYYMHLTKKTFHFPYMRTVAKLSVGSGKHVFLMLNKTNLY